MIWEDLVSGVLEKESFLCHRPKAHHTKCDKNNDDIFEQYYEEPVNNLIKNKNLYKGKFENWKDIFSKY